jgi:hypothetical protein
MLSAVVLAATAAVATPAAAAAEPPIACRPHALSKAEHQRQQDLLAAVMRRVRATEELPDGYLLRLPAEPDLFVTAAEWAGLERRCCPFLAFSLEWTRDDSVSVRVTGGQGAKEFLAAEFLAAQPTP